MNETIIALEKIIEQSYEKINQIQSSCKHVGAIKTPRSDTGNYDPSCNSYWYDCKCETCGKFWREDQ